MDHLCYLCLVPFASVHCCHVVTCWERADLLALVCDVKFSFCYFPMWYPWSGVVYLIVSISDLYQLSYYGFPTRNRDNSATDGLKTKSSKHIVSKPTFDQFEANTATCLDRVLCLCVISVKSKVTRGINRLSLKRGFNIEEVYNSSGLVVNPIIINLSRMFALIKKNVKIKWPIVKQRIIDGLGLIRLFF